MSLADMYMKWESMCNHVCRSCDVCAYNQKQSINKSINQSPQKDIYIYSCGVIIWSKFGLFRGYYLVQVCFLHWLSKSTIKIGVSAHFFWTKSRARKFQGLLSGPSLHLKRTKIGPDNNPYLDQILTPQNVFFGEMFALKMCQNTYFYSVFWKSTKVAKSQKTITFHILQNTGKRKKTTLCCNPPLEQKSVFLFFYSHFLQEKHWCWPKTKLKSRKKKQR